MIELLVGAISPLLDKFIPDADQRNKLAHEIATMTQRQAHEIAKAQIEVNKTEAAHKNLFVAGWRPFIGWTCGVAMANNFIVMPYVAAFTATNVLMLDLSQMMPVLMGLLGLGAYRSYEKVKGVAREK